MDMKIIARIHTPFEEKFGIPRQSGLADNLSYIVFEPLFRNIEAVRGLEDFSHLWIIWQFSESVRDSWSPTVRPPKLGGNKRMGVFATRSPFRPNPVGLSSVRLERVDTKCENAPVLYVRGADILDNTPVYDIKPYIAYTDCHFDAVCGFSQSPDIVMNIQIPDELLEKLPEKYRSEVISILSHDPRPGYINDPDRVFYLKYGGYEIAFKIVDNCVTVVGVSKE